MLVLKTLSQGGVIAVAKIVETIDEMTAAYRGDVSAFDNVCPKVKREKLAVRLLLQDLCGDVQLEYNADGKPLFADGSQNISISHTKNFVAIFVHPTASVGVDIEQRSGRAARLCKRFLSADEMPANNAIEPYAELCWCAKEAIYKMMSEASIVDFLKMKIEPFQLSNEGFINASESKTSEKRNFELQYIQSEEFSLVWGTTAK